MRSRRAKALFALGLALMAVGLTVLWVAPIESEPRYEKIYIYNATTDEPVFYMLKKKGMVLGRLRPYVEAYERLVPPWWRW